MANLKTTHPHFVRCLIPNERKAPGKEMGTEGLPGGGTASSSWAKVGLFSILGLGQHTMQRRFCWHGCTSAGKLGRIGSSVSKHVELEMQSLLPATCSAPGIPVLELTGDYEAVRSMNQH